VAENLYHWFYSYSYSKERVGMQLTYGPNNWGFSFLEKVIALDRFNRFRARARVRARVSTNH